jgi:hypothetical protein
MDSNTSFSNSIYLEQETREDVELAAFTQAVAAAFGSEQALLSERDWLSESDSMDTPPLSMVRNWRAVTIAASFRFAGGERAFANLLSAKRSS